MLRKTPLKRKTPLRAKKPWRWQPKPGKEANPSPKPIKQRQSMKRAGKKTKEWEACRAKLKPAFERAGITVCELKYSGCWRDNGLGFAHLKKRRNLKPEELSHVALLCCVCHDKVEILPESEMGRILLEVIEARKIQPSI